MTDPATVRQLLEDFRDDRISLDEALGALGQAAASLTAGLAEAQVDLDRRRRCGYPEVVFCQGKSTEAVVEILGTLVQNGQDAFATRATAEQAAAVQSHFPDAHYNPVARTLRIDVTDHTPLAGKVVVVTAGTSDRGVAEEALETARWMRCRTDLIVDVGVAGPQRLRQQLPRLLDADALVVVAGMEGALPSVVGGYVACPVVAVPTSVGYGASLGGIAALLSMLNSCAANVTVVNIDAGFKGGYVAGLIARRAKDVDGVAQSSGADAEESR